MTNEEAIKQMESAIISGSIDNVQCGALKMAISALESIDRITAERDAAIADIPHECRFCKYEISGKANEVSLQHITCPVCGLGVWANSINPVNFDEVYRAKNEGITKRLAESDEEET